MTYHGARMPRTGANHAIQNRGSKSSEIPAASTSLAAADDSTCQVEMVAAGLWPTALSVEHGLGLQGAQYSELGKGLRYDK